MTKQGLEAIERAAAHENCACVPEGWKSAIRDAIRIVSIDADSLRASNTIGEEWTDFEAKADYDHEVELVERLEAMLAAAPAAPTEGAKASKRECSACDGTGGLLTDCHECHGIGSIDVTHEPLRDGYTETYGQPCDACGGTGKAPTEGARDTAPPATPVDTAPMYKALMESRIALLAVNSGASQKAVALIDAVLNAAPERDISAEPDEASAQQDEREAPPFTGHWRGGNGVISCGTLRIFSENFDTNPADHIKGGIVKWVCDTLNEAQKARQVQADAAVGTAVAEVQRNEAGQIHMLGADGNSFDMSRYVGVSFYTHPDPLLAECVEALEMAELWLEDTNNAAIAEIRRVLAKVQAVKEGKS